jgi:hypothetical protein
MRSLEKGQARRVNGRVPRDSFAATAALTWMLALSFGCSGLVGSPGNGPNGAGANATNTGVGGSIGSGSGNGGAGTKVSLDCTLPTPGIAPIRRLTRFEYSNTMRDLLGDTTSPGDLLPPELKGNGFSNDATTLTTPRLLVDTYQSVSHDIAARATQDAATVTKTTGCDTTTTSETACAQAFVNSFGPRAFRRPLDSTESAAILGVYTTIRPTTTYADAIAAVIEMVVQSPQFLYRPELGVPLAGSTTVARITGYEMATRLSYLLWGALPDQTLLDAAKNGQLETKAQVQAQATRMLSNPHTKDVSHFFHDTWLGILGIDGLQKDTTWAPFATYNPSLAQMFRLETEQYIDNVIWTNNGNLSSLYAAPYTFLNGALSKFYGFGNVTGDAYQMVPTDGKQRGGLLTQASILTSTTPGSHNNPVVRGKFIYTQLLCGTVPDPPPGLNVMEPTPDPTLTMRELFEAHRASATCAGCHTMLDPIGFGLEHYNGVGLWQDTDNNKPIDSTGNIPNKDIAGEFNGAIELGQKLAGSTDAQNCYVGQWMTFAYGHVETPSDACNRASLQTAFSGAKGNVQRLLVALTQTDGFLYRPVAQ